MGFIVFKNVNPSKPANVEFEKKMNGPLSVATDWMPALSVAQLGAVFQVWGPENPIPIQKRDQLKNSTWNESNETKTVMRRCGRSARSDRVSSGVPLGATAALASMATSTGRRRFSHIDVSDGPLPQTTEFLDMGRPGGGLRRSFTCSDFLQLQPRDECDFPLLRSFFFRMCVCVFEFVFVYVPIIQHSFHAVLVYFFFPADGDVTSWK